MIKSQSIRVLDAVLIAPLMMYSGIRTSYERPVPGFALAFLGAATLIYNAQNWFQYREVSKQIDSHGKTVIFYEGKPYEIKKL